MGTRNQHLLRLSVVGLVVLGVAPTAQRAPAAQTAPPAAGASAFQYELDPAWPKPLPNNWAFGAVWGVATDSHDHVWVVHNKRNYLDQIAAAGKQPAPPVVEFDADGNVVHAWGGPGRGYSWMGRNYEVLWVGTTSEHGLFVDAKDNVWLTGNGHVALEFTPTGKFLLQIGQLWRTNGSNDHRFLGNPTDLSVDAAGNEVYIADGYINQRVIVFDAKTGAYKRHWGAYGKPPDDGPTEKFDPNHLKAERYYISHCAQIARDGLVYVCDSEHQRIQVFRRDGTFLNEVFVKTDTPGRTTSGVAFSPDQAQQYLYDADPTNRKVWVMRRSDMQILGYADLKIVGARAGTLHYIAADSKSNIFTAGFHPTSPQKYVFKGMSKDKP